MEVTAGNSFVPRRERQRWDRRDRRENNIVPVYRTVPAPAIQPEAPKKQSYAKDLDDLDNVDDFFDSDTEYPETKTATFIVPEAQSVASLGITKSVAPVPTPSKENETHVYHRTPKFTPNKTPQSSTHRKPLSEINERQSFTPFQSRRSVSQMTPGTSNDTGTYSSSSDFNFPLPPLPETPAKAAHFPDINLKTPPFSPPTTSHSVQEIMMDIDLQSVAQSLAPAPMPSSVPKKKKKAPRRKATEVPQFTSEIVLDSLLPVDEAPRPRLSASSMFADDEASIGKTFESSHDTLDKTPCSLTPAPKSSTMHRPSNTPSMPSPSPNSPSESPTKRDSVSTHEPEIPRRESTHDIPNETLPASISSTKVSKQQKKPIRPKKQKKSRPTSISKETSRGKPATKFASVVASPFSSTLMETSMESPQSSISPLNLQLDETSFLSYNSGSDSETSTVTEMSAKADQVVKPIKVREISTRPGESLLDTPSTTPRSMREEESMMDVSMGPEEDEDPEDFEIGKGIHLSDLHLVKTDRIKKIMKHYRLPVYGRKAEMIERLTKHLKDTKAGRKRMDSLAPSPSPRKPRNSLVDEDDSVGSKRKRITRTKPLAYWNNERVQYSHKRRQSSDFATVVDLIRQPDTSDCLPPSKRRKYREEAFPPIPVYSTAQNKDVKFNAVKNQSMLEWSALTELEESVSSDITTITDEPERVGHPVHRAFAFNNDYFATGQLEVAPKQCTPLQNTRGSQEFFYVIAGTAEVLINKDTFVMKRGCYFYVPPMNDYYIKNPTTSSYLSIIFFRSTDYDESSDASTS